MQSLSECVQTIWPLSENFEYAAEVGLELRVAHPDWWRRFELATPLDELYPLGQAQGFAFMVWLESHFADPDARLELLLAVERVLRDGPGRLRVELRASAQCMSRDFTPRPQRLPAPVLHGQPVVLYAPGACAGYPDGQTAHLDRWTQSALAGAAVRVADSPPASISDLQAVHDGRYLEGLFALAAAGGGLLSPETVVTAQAPAAVLAGAGAMIEATRQALAGERGPHLVAARPGSHHAERSRGGGTCLVNNVAVAAVWALGHGARQVAVVDLDAHHGNGTEQIFREEPRVFCGSVHQQAPFFPGTGSSGERGRGAGQGSNFNVPMAPGSGWIEHVRLLVGQVARTRPRLVLVEFSADAHDADPVSDLGASDEDFYDAAKLLYALRCPLVFELGASLSQRAWEGALAGLVQAAADAA